MGTECHKYPLKPSFDVSPVDMQSLMIKQATVTDEESIEESVAEVPHKINIVLNWFEGLKEGIPTD